jgi:hypothetical protein
MTARPRKVEETTADELVISELSSTEALMIAERADCRVLQQQKLSGRRLRNRVIVANVIAWIAIVVLIRLMFF